MLTLTKPIIAIDLDLDKEVVTETNKEPRSRIYDIYAKIWYNKLYHYLYYSGATVYQPYNVVEDDCCVLDNTYIDELLSPTEDELEYLTVILGDLVVERYRELLEVINVQDWS